MGSSDSVRHRIPTLTGLLVLVAVLGAGPSPAQETTAPTVGGIQLLHSGPDAVRFEIDDLVPVWSEETGATGGEPRYSLAFPGFLTTGEPGHPAVPRLGGWVVVPPGTKPVLSVVREQWSPAQGRLLKVEAVPVILQGEDPLDNAAGIIRVLPGEAIPSDAMVPEAALLSLAKRGTPRSGSAARLGATTWWRGRRIVSYALVPVRHDGQGRAGEVLRAGAWEIRFVPDSEAGSADPPGAHALKMAGTHDDRFSSIFLNSDQLASQPTEAGWRGVTPRSDSVGEKSRPKAVGSLLGPETRLAIWRTGLVRVTYDRLRSRNLIPDGVIMEDQIRIYQRRYLSRLDDGAGGQPYVELEVPLYMVGEGDVFDGDDFLVFYGLRLNDDTEFVTDVGAGPETIPGCGDEKEWNNEANFYWLAASTPETGQPWARMSETTLPAAAGAPLTTYRRLDHYEEQEGFRENIPTVIEDRLYYNFYRDSEASASINPLWSPDPSGTDVEIKIGFAGWSNINRTVGLEVVTDQDTKTHLADITISSLYDSVRTFMVPAAAIDGVSSKVRMFSLTDPPSFLWSYLNWVEISYDALFQTVSDRLEFHGGAAAGGRPMEVTGFSNNDVGLVEITDPRHPVYVQLGPANLLQDGADWKLSLQADQTGTARVFAAEGSFRSGGVPEFPYILSEVAENPRDPTQLTGANPDLIVVAHGDFRAAIDRWVDHRVQRSEGRLNVHVVDVQDLFDWYSGGLKNDRAIKRFTTHAMTRWNSWALTIVGDANENALEKGVLSSTTAWSTDWVPTHYHIQKALSFNPELMATDKWFTTLESGAEDPVSNFPHDVFAPWSMYTGRFPCNSVAELDNMIDKVMAVENVLPGQDWRRRGIFVADDQWSNGYGVDALSKLIYSPGEVVFSLSTRDSLAAMWQGATGVALVDDLVLLADYLDPLHPYDTPPPLPPSRSLDELRDDTADYATGPLISAFNRGGVVAFYQGHANPYVLASELWIDDSRLPLRRRDINLLSNNDKPWLFMGLGCHISDWAQSPYRSESVANEQSLSEKMLVRAGSGASAAYGSSGYEYIAENRLFGEYIFRRWTRNPPISLLETGTPGRSRWVAGELMWAAEADIFAVRRDRIVQEMVAQYVLLGDPLMVIDAGEPVVTATLVGNPDQEISGEADLMALDSSSQRTVTIAARDEAGIDRIQVVDNSSGADITDLVVTETLPPGATTHQRVDYTLAVDIRPFDHSLTVRIHDTGGPLDSDRHYSLVLNMPQEAVFTTGGEVVDPETFVFPAAEPVAFNTQVISAAWLSEGTERTLTSETLAITDTTWTLDKDLGLTVDFTATAPAENAADEHIVVLTLDGHATEWVLQQGSGTGPVATIGKVYNFPNPMAESTRFVFESGASGVDGVIRVFSSAGRTVVHLRFRYNGGGQGIVDWDGRDDAGDAMANGTYLYRVELDTPEGRVASGMQRLVMMR